MVSRYNRVFYGPIRKIKYLALVAFIVVYIILWILPAKYTLTRTASALSLVGIYISLLLVSWRIIWVRAGLIAIMMFFAVFLILPIGEVEGQISGESYSTELKKYENTNYVWGGENFIGIDCSGLIRRPLIDLTLRESVKRINPSMLRYGLSLWYNDASARYMATGYDNRIEKLYENLTINDLKNKIVNLGDIAITVNGVHVLAYIGNNEWIQSDPTDMKVTINKSSANSPWFNQPVNIYRFRCIRNP